MKRVLLSLLLLLVAGSAYALEKCMTGNYYDPASDGQGFDLQVSDETVVVSFFGYAGNSKYWFLGTGANQDSDEIYLTAYETEKDDNGDVWYPKVGDMTIYTWEDPNKLSISWNFSLDLDRLNEPGIAIPWCNSMCQGDETVVALFRPIDCE